MELVIAILLIFCIIILSIGTIILGALIINRQKENDILIKDLIKSTIESSTKNADLINMRLISLSTEVILNQPPVTQGDIDDYEKTIKSRDSDIVSKILEGATEGTFDPYEAAEKIRSEQANNKETEEELFSPSDILPDQGAVYNQGKVEGK